MSKYQKKTIARAPVVIRAKMRIANELDTQLNRLRNEIKKDIETAIENRELEVTNAVLQRNLDISRGKGHPDPATPTKEEFTGLPWDEEDDGLGDMPSFNTWNSSGNKVCGCMAWGLSDEQAKEIEIWRHVPNCPRANHRPGAEYVSGGQQ